MEHIVQGDLDPVRWLRPGLLLNKQQQQKKTIVTALYHINWFFQGWFLSVEELRPLCHQQSPHSVQGGKKIFTSSRNKSQPYWESNTGQTRYELNILTTRPPALGARVVPILHPASRKRRQMGVGAGICSEVNNIVIC